jgi:hypothetical protein
MNHWLKLKVIFIFVKDSKIINPAGKSPHTLPGGFFIAFFYPEDIKGKKVIVADHLIY